MVKTSNKNNVSKSPVYMFECIVCKKPFYSFDIGARHCGKLAQWASGIEGKGVNLKSPRVKIKVSGYIEMTEENLNNILAYDDPHRGLVYSMNMGYCDSSNVEFSPEE